MAMTMDELEYTWKELDEAGMAAAYSFSDFGFDNVDDDLVTISDFASNIGEKLDAHLTKFQDMCSSYTGVSGNDFEDYAESMREFATGGKSVEDAMGDDLAATGEEMLAFIDERRGELEADMDELSDLKERVERSLGKMEQGLSFMDELKKNVKNAIGR